MNFVDAALGGGSVNVGRYGTAVAAGAADGRTDVLTLLLHETMHSIGISSDSTRFENLVGPDTVATDPNRPLNIPASLTGLPLDFVIGFLAESSHIDPVSAGAVYEHTVTSEPSFTDGDRWLTTGAEIYAICVIEGCAANEVNPNLVGPNAVPEPGTLLLISVAGLGMIGIARRRRQLRA